MSLQSSGRLLEIMRQSSIRNIYEALVELITNSYDAYTRAQKIEKEIEVSFVEVPFEKKIDICVVDQATGMDLEEMTKSLFVVGGYTSSESSRGFFGRGCKDCSFLGDITFTCIKSGVMNQVVIRQNMSTEILIRDVWVNEIHRNNYKISVNGCHVCLRVNSKIVPDSAEETYERLNNNIYLRNLFKDSIITFAQGIFRKRFMYTHGERKKLISCDYDLKEYGTTAHLEIFKSSKPLPIHRSPDERHSGIMVQSSKSVFEVSGLFYNDETVTQDYIYNPNFQYISGTLVCDKIDELARDAIGGKTSDINPYSPVDSNRRDGLLKAHPFTKTLYKYAYYMLSIVIERIQDGTDEEKIGNGNAADIIKSLSDMLDELLPQESVLYAYRDHDENAKLEILSQNLTNVEIDNDFMGLTWDQIQDLVSQKFLKIASKEKTKSGFNISFSTDASMQKQYDIQYLPGQTLLKINANDPSIREYLIIDKESVNLKNYGKATTNIGGCILKAVGDLMLRNEIISGKTSSVDINGFNEASYIYEKSRQNTRNSIYSRINSSIKEYKISKGNDLNPV